MDPLPGLVGHGGLKGALAETAVILVIALLTAWVWWRERRRRRRGESRRPTMRE